MYYLLRIIVLALYLNTVYSSCCHKLCCCPSCPGKCDDPIPSNPGPCLCDSVVCTRAIIKIPIQFRLRQDGGTYAGPNPIPYDNNIVPGPSYPSAPYPIQPDSYAQPPVSLSNSYIAPPLPIPSGPSVPPVPINPSQPSPSSYWPGPPEPLRPFDPSVPPFTVPPIPFTVPPVPFPFPSIVTAPPYFPAPSYSTPSPIAPYNPIPSYNPIYPPNPIPPQPIPSGLYPVASTFPPYQPPNGTYVIPTVVPYIPNSSYVPPAPIYPAPVEPCSSGSCQQACTCETICTDDCYNKKKCDGCDSNISGWGIVLLVGIIAIALLIAGLLIGLCIWCIKNRRKSRRVQVEPHRIQISGPYPPATYAPASRRLEHSVEYEAQEVRN